MRTVQWELRVAAKGLGLGQEVHRLAGAVGNKPQRSANALSATSAVLLPQVWNLLAACFVTETTGTWASLELAILLP